MNGRNVLSNTIGSATVFVVLAAGTLAATPAHASSPPRPTVSARSSVVIPWHGCQSTGKWVHVTYYRGSRIDSAEVVSVRKHGYTFPISEYNVCGYMGSGTYTLKVHIAWSVSHRVTKWVPVYVEREVDVPFTCTLDHPADPSAFYDEYEYASYKCAYDDGREWDNDIEYTDDPTDLDYYERFYAVNLPTGWRSELYEGYLDVYPTNPVPASEQPQTITGATTETEEFVQYRKKRVTRWNSKPTMNVSRVVQVTVR